MKVWSWILIAVGVAIVTFCEKIVFPGLEILLGIETIVGKENVVYLDEGGYIFTDPTAMMYWIGSVALIGLAAVVAGVILLRKNKKRGRPTTG